MAEVRRGELYFADLSPVVGSEQGGVRPVLILQNDTANRCSPTVIVAALTSKTGKPPLPTHVVVSPAQSGLRRTSIVLLEQIRTLDRSRLGRRIGKLGENVMRRVERALCVSLALPAAILGESEFH